MTSTQPAVESDLVAASLSALTWGKGMSMHTRRSVTNYCAMWGVDPVTELELFDGQFYLKAEYFMRKLGELRASGLVLDFWLEHIHNDERLRHTFKEDEDAPPEIKEAARSQWYHMMMKRAEFNVPEEAIAACVCYIKLPGDGHLVTGTKWGGNGTSVRQLGPRGKKTANAIVEDNPELSVETQCVRRAMRLVTSHISGGAMLNDIERALDGINTEHRSELEQIDARRERESELSGPAPEPRPLPAGHGYDPLPTDEPPRAGAPARRVVVQHG